MRRPWGSVVVLALAAAAGGCALDGWGGTTGDDGDDDASDVDADGDGVLDTEDNCVTADNPSQSDEDHDDAGDACDLCPAIAGDHTDGDGDGIGDQCDPDPGEPGDQLLLFDGFNSTALDPAWTEVSDGEAPTWTVNAGALIAHVGDNESVMLQQVGDPGDKLVIDVAAYAEEIGPGVDRSFGVLSDASVTPLAYDFCAASFSDQQIELSRFENGNWFVVEEAGLSAGIGAYEVQTRTTAGAACTVNDQTLDSVATAGDDDHVGFRVRGAKVRISYIAVYRSP